MRYLTFTALVLLASSLSAKADDIDMSAFPCSDVNIASPESLRSNLYWLDGYFAGASESKVFSQEAFGELEKAVVAACAANPDRLVFDVIAEHFAQ